MEKTNENVGAGDSAKTNGNVSADNSVKTNENINESFKNATNATTKESASGETDENTVDNGKEHYQKLDPRIITAWKISRWIRFLVFAILLSIPNIILYFQDFYLSILIPIIVFDAIIGAYLLITPFLYPAIEYRQWGYIITEDRVEIRHGIFFIQTTIIPIIRVQHVTISQGPIKRKLGISSIDINTASGAFKIEGLSDADAMQIAKSLKSKLLVRMDKQVKI